MLYVCTLHLYVCTVCIYVYTLICCVYTCIIYVCTYLYWFSTFVIVFQHAHIENIKFVANLTNNKDVFMCILRFYARAGYHLAQRAERASCIWSCASRPVWGGSCCSGWPKFWTCRASLGLAILHIWSCSLAERHNRKIRYFPVFYLYILCLCAYVLCIYVSVQACTPYTI